MNMVTTKTCCFVYNLRAGCLIIGWIQLVLPAISVVLDITAQVQLAHGHTALAFDLGYKKGFNAIWGDLVIAVFQVIVAVCLLYGVYVHRKKFVYFYVFAEAALVFLQIILVIALVVTASYENTALTIAYNAVSCAIWAYLVIVVYSYYKEIEVVE